MQQLKLIPTILVFLFFIQAHTQTLPKSQLLLIESLSDDIQFINTRIKSIVQIPNERHNIYKIETSKFTYTYVNMYGNSITNGIDSLYSSNGTYPIFIINDSIYILNQDNKLINIVGKKHIEQNGDFFTIEDGY